jgi:hypothetical protein
MNNSIASLSFDIDARDPACAVVRVQVTPRIAQPGLEVRGRLMGPSCAYASTIEVAYAFQPDRGAEGPLSAVARIPEASPWHPVSPHRYYGPVELWQAGQLLDRRAVRLGLRTLSLGPAGLRVNGRVLPLSVRRVTALSEAEARALHAEGVNVLIAPPDEAVFSVADHLGFLVVCETDADAMAAYRHRPSCLGVIDPVSAATMGDPLSPVELPGLRVIGA